MKTKLLIFFNFILLFLFPTISITDSVDDDIHFRLFSEFSGDQELRKVLEERLYRAFSHSIFSKGSAIFLSGNKNEEINLFKIITDTLYQISDEIKAISNDEKFLSSLTSRSGTFRFYLMPLSRDKMPGLPALGERDLDDASRQGTINTLIGAYRVTKSGDGLTQSRKVPWNELNILSKSYFKNKSSGPVEFLGARVLIKFNFERGSRDFFRITPVLLFALKPINQSFPAKDPGVEPLIQEKITSGEWSEEDREIPAFSVTTNLNPNNLLSELDIELKFGSLSGKYVLRIDSAKSASLPTIHGKVNLNSFPALQQKENLRIALQRIANKVSVEIPIRRVIYSVKERAFTKVEAPVEASLFIIKFPSLDKEKELKEAFTAEVDKALGNVSEGLIDTLNRKILSPSGFSIETNKVDLNDLPTISDPELEEIK